MHCTRSIRFDILTYFTSHAALSVYCSKGGSKIGHGSFLDLGFFQTVIYSTLIAINNSLAKISIRQNNFDQK